MGANTSRVGAQEVDIIGPMSPIQRMYGAGRWLFVRRHKIRTVLRALVGKEASMWAGRREDGVADIGVEDNTVGVEEMTSCVG